MFEDNQTFAQFLDDYYAIGPLGYLQYVGKMPDTDLKKILVHTETNWYEYAYMKQVQLMLSVNSEVYKLLDKKPITTVGDSYKYTTALGVDTTAIGPGGTTTIVADWATDVTETSISTIQGITSGIEKVPLSRDLHSMIREKIPAAHPGEPDWDFLKNRVAPMALWDKIDNYLGGYGAGTTHGVDTPALKNIECIDRMISNATESGDTDDVYCSSDSDGDIIWDGIGTGTAKADRSSDTFADAGSVTLPGSDYVASGKAYDIMSELDDIMVAIKKYSQNKRYIGLTTDATLNLLENEISPGYRYLENTVNVQQTIGGISTRPGHKGGFDVGALTLCGVTVPVFTSNAVPTKNTKVGQTTETAGHFFLIDLDDMYIRVDIPVTYLESGFGAEMLSINYFQSRALLFTVAQLVCTNFKPHGALKWIAA